MSRGVKWIASVRCRSVLRLLKVALDRAHHSIAFLHGLDTFATLVIVAMNIVWHSDTKPVAETTTMLDNGCACRSAAPSATGRPYLPRTSAQTHRPGARSFVLRSYDGGLPCNRKLQRSPPLLQPTHLDLDLVTIPQPCTTPQPRPLVTPAIYTPSRAHRSGHYPLPLG